MRINEYVKLNDKKVTSKDKIYNELQTHDEQHH